jgi:hypothetical protein
VGAVERRFARGTTSRTGLVLTAHDRRRTLSANVNGRLRFASGAQPRFLVDHPNGR